MNSFGAVNLKMGSTVSKVGYKVPEKNSKKEDADIKLVSCRLVFSDQQLLKLNSKFSNMLEANTITDSNKKRQIACLGVIVERLIQRLVCNIGNLDSRFSSKFLINLEPLKTCNHDYRESLKYKYLVRLDFLSTPALYPEVFKPPVKVIEGTEDKSLPQGYAKVKVHGELLEHWAGFLNPNGYLRRDKVQERFLELLTKAAARPSEPFSPAQVDESKHCGAPGKIVDPITLFHVLKNPPSHQVFFGSAVITNFIESSDPANCIEATYCDLQCTEVPNFPRKLLSFSNRWTLYNYECNESRFPDPRDFRIAIVEGVPETRLHISFLSPAAQSIASDVEISITFGIGVGGWPMGTNYPLRLPLDHVDVVLGYRAAQLGYYLVPKGPHSSIYCEDRSSMWEIRTLPTEMFLEHHYAFTSVVARVYKILTYLLEILRARGVKTINKYSLKNLLFFEMEQKRRVQHWKPKNISRRVLSILDKLHAFLRNQMVPSYIFTEKNLLLREDTFEDDYVSDREIIEQYLKQLHKDEFKREVDDSQWISARDELENVLLQKWDAVLASMLPPRSNRTKRLRAVNSSNTVSYTHQQMEYIAVLIREMLKLKKIQETNTLTDFAKFNQNFKELSTDKEDFIYLLQIMFDQAKQKIIIAPENFWNKKISNKKLLKLDQMLLSYDISTSMIIDDIRRNKHVEYNFSDDLSVVMKIMECLHKAMDSDGKVLGPVLRPYLNQLFRGSHENCWFLCEWNKKSDFSEFEAIGAFSKLVLSRSINPLHGIINSASKGWNWATHCMQIMEEITEDHSTRIIIGEKINFTDSGLRLVFTPSPGRTVRCTVSIKKSSIPDESKSVTEALNEKCGSDSRYATIKSFQDIFESTLSSEVMKNAQNSLAVKGVSQTKYQKSKSEKQPFHVQLREGNPFTIASMATRRQGNHRGLGSIVRALISLQKLTVLQEISQYLPESERTRVLSDIKKLSKEVQRVAVENYRKKKKFSLTARSRFIVKKSESAFPVGLMLQKRISKDYSGGLEMSSPMDFGSYKSFNEFSIPNENVEIQKRIKDREEQLDKELKNVKEESLRGTCRQLRKASRPTAFGSGTSYTFPKPGYCRKGSSKSAINTPFYIKVSSYGCTFASDKTS